MNTDLLFDAMDYIDDDMLEEVDALRTKKSIKPNRIWMRYASVAACACIILGAVYMIDRTGLLDRVEVEDGMAQENTSQESKVHGYVRADIITSDNTALAVTDQREITVLFDILNSNLESEAADDKLYSENEKESVDEKTEGVVTPEDACEMIVQPQYTITLVTADESETVYTLTGKVVYCENTGEVFTLCEDQYKELMEILNNN